VNAPGFVVLMMFDIAHPQLAPNLSTGDDIAPAIIYTYTISVAYTK